jgi:hypothetical protein
MVCRSHASPGVCQPGTVVIRIERSLITAYSKKDRAAPTCKRGFGNHPLAGWVDNTGEQAALMLRAGTAGSNTAADLIAVLADAIRANARGGGGRRAAVGRDGADVCRLARGADRG